MKQYSSRHTPHQRLPDASSANSEGKVACHTTLQKIQRRLEASESEVERRKLNSNSSVCPVIALPSPIYDGSASMESAECFLDYCSKNCFEEDGFCTMELVVSGVDELLQGGRNSSLSMSSLGAAGLHRLSTNDLLTNIDDLEAFLLQRVQSSRQSKKHKEKKRLLGKPIRKALHDQILSNCVGSDDVAKYGKINEMAAKRLSSTRETQPGKQRDFRKCGQLQDHEGCTLPLISYKRNHNNKSQGKKGSFDELCCSHDFKEYGELLNSGGLSNTALDQRFSKKNNKSIQLQHQDSCSDHSTSMAYCQSPDPGLYKICWAQQNSYFMLKILEESSSDSKPCSRSSSSPCNSLSSDHNLDNINMAGDIKSPSLCDQEPISKKKARLPISLRQSYVHKRLLLHRTIAMEKRSYNPLQDFKDSMVEVILANNLHRSNDLVELLQCYLTLNPTKCHHTIVEAFGEVWSNVFHLL